MKIEEKRQRKKNVVSKMIMIYCRGNKHEITERGLCTGCEELITYAMLRTDHCPFMETKTFWY